MVSRTGSDGDTTKLNALSAFNASSARRTVPLKFFELIVTGSKVTDADPPGSTFSGLFATGMPAVSSATLLPETARSVRLVTTAVTVRRSWLENVERAIDRP